VDDEKSDVVTHVGGLPTVEPHDEKSGFGFETEAVEAATEGTSAEVALRDRSSRPHVNPMRIGVALVFGVEVKITEEENEAPTDPA
jgi:hypothetical protein